MSTRRRRKPDRPEEREPGEIWTPSAMPFELAPQELRRETMREIESLEIASLSTPVVSFEDRGPAELRPTERRYEFIEPVSSSPDLRPERSVDITMVEVPMTSFEMRELRERRVKARDLGWKVPGLRIRTP